MAAFGKATMYVISEKGLENGPILFDKTTKSRVSCKNALLKKAQSQLRKKTHACKVSKCTLECHDVVKRSRATAIGVLNLADVIPEQNTKARVEKTFNSLSRELQNGDIVFYSLFKENRAERSCKVRQLLFNMEEHFDKFDNTLVGKSFGGKTVVPKQYRREVLSSKYSNRNEGLNFQTDAMVTDGDEDCFQELNDGENMKEKLPLIKGEKIKDCITKEARTCISRKFANLIKTNSTDGNESLNERLIGTEKANYIKKRSEMFKTIRNDFYKIKPDVFVCMERNGCRVDRGYNLLETERKEKPNSLVKNRLPVAAKNNNPRELPSPLIPLNGGYLSRGIDCKRGPFARIKAPLFVDESTGRSHALPGVVTFERSDYNKWSRQNRDRFYGPECSVSTRYARKLLPSIEKNN